MVYGYFYRFFSCVYLLSLIFSPVTTLPSTQYWNIPSFAVESIPAATVTDLSNVLPSGLGMSQLPAVQSGQAVQRSLLDPTISTVPDFSLLGTTQPDLFTSMQTNHGAGLGDVGNSVLNTLTGSATSMDSTLFNSLPITRSVIGDSGLQPTTSTILGNPSMSVIQPSVQSMFSSHSGYSKHGHMSYLPTINTNNNNGIFMPLGRSSGVLPLTQSTPLGTGRSVSVTTPSITLNTVKTSILPPIVRTGVVSYQPVMPKPLPIIIRYVKKPMKIKKMKKHVFKEYHNHDSFHNYEEGGFHPDLMDDFGFHRHRRPFLKHNRGFHQPSEYEEWRKFKNRRIHQYRHKKFMHNFMNRRF